MSATLEEVVTRGPGAFADVVPQFKSVSLISEIQSERLKKDELKKQWFYCGDGIVYGLKGDEVFMDLTDFANNPLMKDPENAASQLINNQNFFVSPQTCADLEAKAASGNGVVAFNLSSLKKYLKKEGNNEEYRFIEVSTAKLAEGRDAFQLEYGEDVTRLFDRVQGNDIYGAEGIGSQLLGEGKSTTRIWMLNLEYVKHTLKGKENGTMIARASCLSYFDDRSSVSLNVRFVSYRGHVRGVVKETAEGGAPQGINYLNIASQLSRPDFDPNKMAATLNPKSAKNIALALAGYVQK